MFSVVPSVKIHGPSTVLLWPCLYLYYHRTNQFSTLYHIYYFTVNELQLTPECHIIPIQYAVWKSDLLSSTLNLPLAHVQVHYINALKPSGFICTACFNILEHSILHTVWICVIQVVLTVHINCFPKQQ